MTTAGFPHSEILGSKPGCRLLEAYRRLQRPSSAPGAKTSTVCSYKLDTACTTCKLLADANLKRFTSDLPEKVRAEDARVHCVVLKLRTEPCIANLHQEIRDDRPFEEKPCEAAASSGPNSVLTQATISVRSFGCPASGLPTSRAIARQPGE
jgi:hypothetical protein